jgi:hypothetical protein
MSTPIEAGAKAATDILVEEFNGPLTRVLGSAPAILRPIMARIGLKIAKAVFGSIDAKGLAEILGAHQDMTDRSARDGCSCGWDQDISHPETHQADAILAWLTGGE